MVLAAIEGWESVAEPNPETTSKESRAFARFDTNKDGQLSAQEFGKTGIAKRRPGLFNRLDANGDGFLSVREAAALARRR